MTEPAPEEWKQLYEVAVQFRDLAPWNWMLEDHMFGVQDPECGEIGYCVVMGGMGEHFALGVYRGSEGLEALWHLREGPPPELVDPLEVLASQNCLMASFEDRGLLQKRDLDTIKSLGLKFRGRQAWPFFRSYVPGCQPWFLTDHEARFLALALEQSIEIFHRFRNNPRLLPSARPRGSLLVRMQEAGEWRDSMQQPAPVAAPRPPAATVDEVEEARARRLGQTLGKTDGVLEIDYFYSPGAVKEPDDERPWFPYILLVADARSGLIFGTEVVRPAEIAPALVRQVLDILEQLGMLPDRMVVRRREAYSILNPVARKLGVRLNRAPRLRAVEAAQEGFLAFSRG